MLRPRILCSALLPLLTALPTAQERPDPPRIMRMVPIHDLVSTTDAPTAPVFGTFLGIEEDVSELFVMGEGRRQLLERDQVEQLLVDLLCNGVFDSGDASLNMTGSVAVITGAEPAVKSVESALDQLRKAVVRPVRLSAALYRIPGDRSFPAFAAADNLPQLIAGLPRIWSAERVGPAGLQVGLGNTRRSRYIRDVDVEVAQEASIGAPIVSELFEGIDLVLEPHVLAGSEDVVVFGQFAFGERKGPLSGRSVGVEGHPSIDVPVLDINSGTLSGRIPPGGALLISVRSPHDTASNLLLTVSATPTRPALAEIGGISVFPISALTSDALREHLHRQPLQHFSRALELERREAEGRYFGPRNPDEFLSMLEVADKGSEERCTVSGRYLFVAGTPAERRFAGEFVQTLQQRWLRNTRIEVQHQLLPGTSDGAVFAQTGEIDKDTKLDLLHAVAFPAIAGRAHAVVSGRETTVVNDFDVEIAQDSSTADPVVGSAFSGLVMTCFPYPQAEQASLGARIELASIYTPSGDRRAVEMKIGGTLYVGEPRVAKVGHDDTIVSGREIVLGSGPIVRVSGIERPTRQSVRVSVR